MLNVFHVGRDISESVTNFDEKQWLIKYDYHFFSQTNSRENGHNGSYLFMHCSPFVFRFPIYLLQKQPVVMDIRSFLVVADWLLVFSSLLSNKTAHILHSSCSVHPVNKKNTRFMKKEFSCYIFSNCFFLFQILELSANLWYCINHLDLEFLLFLK